MQDFLRVLITEAGDLACQYFTRGVTFSEKTNRSDLLTEADVSVNDFIVKKIQATYPTHHIHSEEMSEDVNPGAEYEWVIDPIDGTRNFALGIPFWAILIVVLKTGEPWLAAIYNPVAKQLFFASRGQGGWLNQARLRVNDVDSFAHSFGVMYCNTQAPFEARYRQASRKLLSETSAWLHNYGSMLITVYLASGGVDFYATNCGFDHDYLAPALICSEAGALVTDSDGQPWRRGRRDIVMANPQLHPKILALWRDNQP